MDGWDVLASVQQHGSTVVQVGIGQISDIIGGCAKKWREGHPAHHEGKWYHNVLWLPIILLGTRAVSFRESLGSKNR